METARSGPALHAWEADSALGTMVILCSGAVARGVRVVHAVAMAQQRLTIPGD